MVKNRLQELAEGLGVSKATVSRALRHCAGVDSETRLTILRDAKEYGVEAPSDPCDVYCILPDTPRYFWRRFSGEIRENVRRDPVSVKLNLYTRIPDSETVGIYLDEAEKLRVKVVIIAAKLTTENLKKLSAMQKRGVLVILLSEYGELPGSIYVGADAYRDGEALGRLLSLKYPGRIPLILTSDLSPNASRRISGFRHALEELQPSIGRDPRISYLTEEELGNAKTIPAHLASLLTGMDAPCTSIYIPFGNIDLSLSLHKAGQDGSDTVLLAHDSFSDQSPGRALGGYTAVCSQDIVAQVTSAMNMARSFLECPRLPVGQIFYYVPSRILTAE